MTKKEKLAPWKKKPLPQSVRLVSNVRHTSKSGAYQQRVLNDLFRDRECVPVAEMKQTFVRYGVGRSGVDNHIYYLLAYGHIVAA